MSDIIKTEVKWSSIKDKTKKEASPVTKLTEAQALKVLTRIILHSMSSLTDCKILYKDYPFSEISGVMTAIAQNNIELEKIRKQIESWK
jgi:hypothetical protein